MVNSVRRKKPQCSEQIATITLGTKYLELEANCFVITVLDPFSCGNDIAVKRVATSLARLYGKNYVAFCSAMEKSRSLSADLIRPSAFWNSLLFGL